MVTVSKTASILFSAAIALGDRLKALPEATSEDMWNIEQTQEVLRRLPYANLDVDAWYGFSIANYDKGFRGINRGWYVSIEGKFHLINIYSIHRTVPDEERDEEHDKSMEDDFVFSLEGSYEYSQESYTRWIDASIDPNRWRNPNQAFELKTYFDE